MRTVDLFAGCGGLSLGFQRQGFEIVAAFDNWAKAAASEDRDVEGVCAIFWQVLFC